MACILCVHRDELLAFELSEQPAEVLMTESHTAGSGAADMSLFAEKVCVCVCVCNYVFVCNECSMFVGR